MRVAKDTTTVKRCLIDYGGIKPLKIEVSYRRKEIPDEEITVINTIRVYKTDTLASMKSYAYQGRDKLRALYDLAFICDHFYDQLSLTTKFGIQTALSYKGLEQLDYLLATQNDPLIHGPTLTDKFLKMYEKMGLLSD